MNEGKIEFALNNGIGTISFSHPQSNSLPGTLLTRLAGEIEKAGKDKNIIVMVLRSEGEKAFCAGASFDELLAIRDFAAGTKFFSGFADVINAMRKAPKFILCRVQGKAVGGGIGLAAAADYTLATESASVRLSELSLGIGPFVVGPAVERKVGVSAFSQMTLNAGECMPAEWAREKGLYASIHPDISTMDKALEELAGKLVQCNPEAMALLKNMLWEETDDWDVLLEKRAQMSGRLVLSEFTRRSIDRFKQGKR